MGLVFAAIDRVVLDVGVLEEIIVPGDVCGIEIADDSIGVGLLSVVGTLHAKERHEAHQDRTGCPKIH